MRLHPTRATFHVALAGALLLALSVATRSPSVAAFGGAMILAVALGRATAMTSVTRLRAAGFEMVWTSSRRVLRAARGEVVTLEAELRNRSDEPMRGVSLRAVASSYLPTEVQPPTVDLPAHSRVRVNVEITPHRVGRWGVHGMALEVRGTPVGGEGLYEVPLMFANPFGIEVFPRSLHVMLQSPRGGRSRRSADAGRSAPVAGDGEELRELRDHQHGDAFKRIAWKASAKRGRLIVREMEREEREVLWLVLDASVELWAGAVGKAPLDDAVDEVAALATRHLARGDRVGLVVFASRMRSWLVPAAGPPHASKIAAALASAASTVDADRCELEEHELAARVAEHARPLDAKGLADLPRGNLDLLAARAEMLRGRAPFAPRVPLSRDKREQAFRHYLAAFGIELPPRTEGERDRAHATLATALDKIHRDKIRPSVVHIFSPAPPPTSEVFASLRRLKARRVEVRWSVPAFEQGTSPSGADLRGVVEEAVRIRARASRERAERILRRLGVRARSFERHTLSGASQELPLDKTIVDAPPIEEA
ncbi:MAG: DUF58 domain-containing protein [Myxococcales bacterium]|nr:DUF58 domain-containing protein [Myxococcales bacterium]